jgi:hypothetical protein
MRVFLACCARATSAWLGGYIFFARNELRQAATRGTANTAGFAGDKVCQTFG